MCGGTSPQPGRRYGPKDFLLAAAVKILLAFVFYLLMATMTLPLASWPTRVQLPPLLYGEGFLRQSQVQTSPRERSKDPLDCSPWSVLPRTSGLAGWPCGIIGNVPDEALLTGGCRERGDKLHLDGVTNTCTESSVPAGRGGRTIFAQLLCDVAGDALGPLLMEVGVVRKASRPMGMLARGEVKE